MRARRELETEQALRVVAGEDLVARRRLEGCERRLGYRLHVPDPPAPARERRLGTPREHGEDLFRPQVLVDVEGRHPRKLY